METSITTLPRPIHEQRSEDTLTLLKAKARAELNSALRRRGMDEIIEWANPSECERGSATMCLLGCTTGLYSCYAMGSEECEGGNYPGSISGINVRTPEGIDNIHFSHDSAVVLLVKMFDHGVLSQLEAV